jgi:hypothetical protein
MFSKIPYCMYQQVELRAFCSKHSELPDDKDTHQLGEAFVAASHNCSVASHDPSELQMDKQHKLNSGRNGDKLAVHIETSDTNSGKPGDGESWEIELNDLKSDAVPLSESGDVDQLIDTGIFERGGYGDASPSDFQNLLLILKKVLKKHMCSCTCLGLTFDEYKYCYMHGYIVSLCFFPSHFYLTCGEI